MPAAWEGAPARSDAAGLAIIGHNASGCVFRYKNFGFATRQRNSRSAQQPISATANQLTSCLRMPSTAQAVRFRAFILRITE
ncbi:MAG: hypothetical protein CBB80_003435 [Synechococcus sp. TMED20]|nr:MAG: hypothetical protein CBB80_003435 [Synechococcus sp. TMED20]